MSRPVVLALMLLFVALTQNVVPGLAQSSDDEVLAVVDRLMIKPEIASRLADSIELATQLSNGRVIVAAQVNVREQYFSGGDLGF